MGRDPYRGASICRGGLVVGQDFFKTYFLEMRVSGDVSEIRKSRFAHFG